MIAFLAALAAASALSASPPAAPVARPAPPSAEAMELARTVAAHDDFLPLVTLSGTAQIKSVEKSLGPLTDAQKAKFSQIGEATMVEGENRVIDRLATDYATRFTTDDLRALATFLPTPAGRAWSGRLPGALPALGEAMKGWDFKRVLLAQVCAEMAKGCPPPAAAKPPAAPAKPETPAAPKR